MVGWMTYFSGFFFPSGCVNIENYFFSFLTKLSPPGWISEAVLCILWTSQRNDGAQALPKIVPHLFGQ